MLLGSQAVSDLPTLPEGTGRHLQGILAFSMEYFSRAFGMSTLPNMSNDPIRNYHPPFSVKQGSERVSNLPKGTQQRNIRVIEEVEPRLSLGVWGRSGDGDFSLSIPSLGHGHSCWALSSPQQTLSSWCHRDWPHPKPRSHCIFGLL